MYGVKENQEVITIPRLSKKAKREWSLFLDPGIARRSYNELCRRRNKRAACEKEIQKYAPFSNRKSTLRVLLRKRRKSARNHTAKQAYKYITKYSKLA